VHLAGAAAAARARAHVEASLARRAGDGGLIDGAASDLLELAERNALQPLLSPSALLSARLMSSLPLAAGPERVSPARVLPLARSQSKTAAAVAHCGARTRHRQAVKLASLSRSLDEPTGSGALPAGASSSVLKDKICRFSNNNHLFFK
jgi:hypothetical protein